MSTDTDHDHQEPDRNRTPTRTCAARGCDSPVPRRLLMCRTHWRQVPADVRASVWLAYRRGQEDNNTPSRAYINAATEAIAAVARHGRHQA